MPYEMTLKQKLLLSFDPTLISTPYYRVPHDVATAKRDAMKHVEAINDCHKYNYGSGTNGEHHLNYNGLRRIAKHYPHEFASWVADGDIPPLYCGMLAIQPGAAHPLLSGVLDILLGSDIPDVKHHAEWLLKIYDLKGYRR